MVTILYMYYHRPELSSVIGLKGCVKGFQFQKKDFNLLEEPGTIGISSGCPEESFVSAPSNTSHIVTDNELCQFHIRCFTKSQTRISRLRENNCFSSKAFTWVSRYCHWRITDMLAEWWVKGNQLWKWDVFLLWQMSRKAYFTGESYLGSTAKISPFENFEGGLNFRTVQPSGLLFYHSEGVQTNQCLYCKAIS